MNAARDLGMGPAIDANEKRRLVELAQEHKAVYEVHPAVSVASGQSVQVGFDIELYGTHGAAVLEGHEPAPSPGCERCVRVWHDLRDVASAVLPPDDRASRYEIVSFDHSLHYDRKRKPRPTIDRPDVKLLIELRHRDVYNRPVDPCESLCLDEIKAALRSLGVQEQTWSDYRAALFLRDLPDAERAMRPNS
jgi:hypothetical protein